MFVLHLFVCLLVTNYTVGGGYVVGLATHPLQQNLVYSRYLPFFLSITIFISNNERRTDVGGAYRLNYATKSWVPLTESFTESTLFGGMLPHFFPSISSYPLLLLFLFPIVIFVLLLIHLVVESIAVDPTNANVVYAAFGNSKSASTGMYLFYILLPLTFIFSHFHFIFDVQEILQHQSGYHMDQDRSLQYCCAW